MTPARYRRAAVWLRRDLRLVDHAALDRARREAAVLAPVFILDPRQLAPHAWRSGPGLWFMREALRALDADLRAAGGGLWLFEGDPVELWPRVAREHELDAVYWNADLTPFARTRDAAVAAALARVDVRTRVEDDVLLRGGADALLNGQGQPYRVFTPFWNGLRRVGVPEPRRPPPRDRWLPPAHAADSRLAAVAAEPPPQLQIRVGRQAALDRLAGMFPADPAAREQPAVAATSGLSADLKFGVLSPREVWHQLPLRGEHRWLIRRQLAWRDFFSQLAWHWPHVFEGPFLRRYEALAWDKRDEHLTAWQTGRTGVPIVDAGMRELEQTGRMHNRVRMIAASFLVKQLHVDWRRGEQWFARRLLDYDPAVNNGNWQWVASIGADAQPWFRIFNPWLQARRFDPEAVYVRRWLPELRTLPPAAVLGLERHLAPAGIDYPRPLVDHHTAARQARARYAALQS